MLRYKQFVLGLLVGGACVVSTTGFAEDGLTKIEGYLRTTLPFTLNGQSVKLDNPVITYDGSTYIKLRDVTKLIPTTSVNWNEQTGTVEMSTFGNTPTPQPTSTKTVTSTQDTFYNEMDINTNYPPTGKRYLDNGHILWMINGVEFDQQEILTDKDKFYIDGSLKQYWSEKYFLHYLTEQQLSQFQKYRVDFSTKTVTPIN